MDDAPRIPPHSEEAETSALGGVLIRNDALGVLIEHGIAVEDFYAPINRVIYAAMLALSERTQPIDTVTVADQVAKLRSDGGGPKPAHLESTLADMAARVPTAENVGYYARVIREMSSRRRLISVCSEIAGKAFDPGGDTTELLDWAEDKVYRVSERAERHSYVRVKHLVVGVYQEVERRHEARGDVTGVPTGLHDLDHLTCGLQARDLIIVAGRPSAGKAQPLDARVKTARGWKYMAQLRVGDELASIDGAPSRVRAVFPRGKRQVYRVTFSDGRSCECCSEHLFRVMHRSWTSSRVVSVTELRRLLSRKRHVGRLWIGTVSGDFGHDHALPVDPWVLGVLIGDGCLQGNSPRVSTADPEVVDGLRSRLPLYEVRHACKYDYRIVTRGGCYRRGVQGIIRNGLRVALSRLGLWNLHSHEKFIPRRYLLASKEARLGLLRGLLDTDGCVDRKKALYFYTTSERLADNVVELARSLGCLCSKKRKQTGYVYRGARRRGRPSFVLNLRHPDLFRFLSLSRKLDRLSGRTRRINRLTVSSIVPSRVTETQCIAVTHPSQLYITDDYIVTHNTAWAAVDVPINAARRPEGPIPTLTFSLEMSRAALTERMIACEGKLDGQRMRGGHLSSQEWRELAAAQARVAEYPIDIDDSSSLTTTEIRAKARRWRGENPGPLGLIVVDYLQLIAGSGSFESREREVAASGKALKALAKELEVPVVAISALKRPKDPRMLDKPPRLSDLRESGSLEFDADVVIFLHRPPKRKDADYRLVKVILEKQRNGPSGESEALFMRESSRFENVSHREPDQGTLQGVA